MIIDRKLNLIVPIERESETKLWIHATPIRKEVFEQYYLVLAKTFSAFAQNGLDFRAAPSVASLILKSIAQSTDRIIGQSWWDGDDGVGGKTGLYAEIIRLSNCLVSTENGWKQLPLQTALDSNLITEEERAETLNQLVFFTVVSLIAPRNDRTILIKGAAAIYQLDVTYSNFTDWSTSFQTQMRDENIGESTTT